ncbi:sterol desaturase family protein [Granulicella sp. WH15]|uniref:sterol desaturase family protein n=1 Tax=Granulicella sp. WH15 TaxID=2602070 RepID=UPI0013A5B513|nr:sterol desaturase family protein [Granulicella sp. WH15]
MASTILAVRSALAVVARHIPTTIFTFMIVGAILYCVHVRKRNENLSLAGFFRFCFPVEHWFTSSTRVDVVIYLISKVTQKVVTLGCQLGMTLLVSWIVLGFKNHFHLTAPFHESFLALAIIVVLVFLLTDFAEFLSHYVQHRIPMLWEFHKVHHSATFLTPFTTTRFHPIGNLIDGIFMSTFIIPAVVVAELCFNLSLVRIVELNAMVELFFTFTLLRQLQHSHFRISFGPLDRIFISPLMHHVHHSAKHEHWDKNFGSRLSVWDWLFGSAFLLPKSEPVRFGLGTIEDERGDYSTVKACYVRPMTGFYQLLKAEILHSIAEDRPELAKRIEAEQHEPALSRAS